MTVVCVHGPLRKPLGDRSEHELAGDTVLELLECLEHQHPEISGWILDERGLIRRHINVFVNGERGARRRRCRPGTGSRCSGDHRRLIDDGTARGDQKGPVPARGESRSSFEIKTRAFAGRAGRLRDPRPAEPARVRDRDLALLRPEIFYTDDPAGAAEWQQAEGVALPEGGAQALERIWVIACGEDDGTLYAGGDPGVLFESHDDGANWELNAGLWEQPSRKDWQPGGGGLCLHSIVTWPGDPDRLAVAVSAAGMWLTEDGGRSWRRGNEGLTRATSRRSPRGRKRRQCVHHVERAPKQPERLFMQFHGGVYRSTTPAKSWTDIGGGASVGLRVPAGGGPRRS